MKTEPVNIAHKLTLFNETWTPKIVGALNGQLVKLAKLDGELMWHAHEHEDELFLVIEGRLTLQLRDQDESMTEVTLDPGEFFIVPRGVQHNPIAAPGTSVLLFEPEATRHTGEKVTDRTVTEQRWI